MDQLNEMRRIFAISLKDKLKEKYIGGVVIKVNDPNNPDICSCMIIRNRPGDLGFIFRYEIRDIQDKIFNGYTSDHALVEIDKAYRKFTLSLIYRKEKSDVNIFKNVLSKQQGQDFSEIKNL